MTAHEPLGPIEDPDETLLVPTPGGRRARAAGQSDAFGPARVVPALGGPALPAGAGGLNPLLSAANPLLELALPLRLLPSVPDVEALRQQLFQMVRAFEAAGREAGIGIEALAAARYCLCTFLDEVISGTPWGTGVWSSRSLLVAFHNEAFGGERFFGILQRLAQAPAENLDVLELLYVILSLGFEGRYRLVEGGRAQLESVRARLEEMIRAQHGPQDNDLSPQWRPAERQRQPLMRLLPVWVAAALAGVLVVVTHILLSLSLNRASDPVFAALHGVHVNPAPALASKLAAAPAPGPQLAAFLAPEIAQGLVTVSRTAGRTTVTLNGDGLFASGSAEVAPARLPLLMRIGDALRDEPGRVIVTGHTDNQRLVSARFPSNWHLSQARAETVRDLLVARTGTPARFTAEGRGDTEPVAPNDTPEHLARNRRVAITLLAPGAAP